MPDLIEAFKQQFNTAIDTYNTEKDPQCAFAAGMLIILSALRRFDGPTIPMQIAAMHTALREVGQARGYIVEKNK